MRWRSSDGPEDTNSNSGSRPSVPKIRRVVELKNVFIKSLSGT